jgi:hypothetical protein
MSYFSRLVEQSHLTVRDGGGNARAVESEIPALSNPITTSGAVNDEPVDLVEINEVVDAPVSSQTAARSELPVSGPSPIVESDTVVIAPTRGVVGVPTAQVDREPKIEGIDTQSVSPPAEAPRPREASPIVEGSTYEVAMRRVLEWVAAGPRPNTLQPPAGDDAPRIEERIVEASVPATREAPMRAIALPSRDEQKLRTVASEPHEPVAAEGAPRANVSPVIDDGVKVSIGSISVRIEAPAPSTPAVTPPSPRAAAPPAQAAPGPERSTRLARRYLHP